MFITTLNARAFGEMVAAAQGSALAFRRSRNRAAKTWQRGQEMAGACG